MLLKQAPAGWTQLRVEFDASASPVASATVTSGPGSTDVAMQVPAAVVGTLSDFRARSQAGGETWDRLTIDCHADGRLSMQTGVVPQRRGPRRSLTWVLAAVTVGASVAAAVVFAQGWSEPRPARATIAAAPTPSPRQQQAFEVLQRWYDAENRNDGAALRALTCAHPGKNVEDEVAGFEQTKTVDGIAYLEAVSAFRDEGDRVWGRFWFRVHPVSERDKLLVEDVQRHGGFFADAYTLVPENGELKVCDADRPPRV